MREIKFRIFDTSSGYFVSDTWYAISSLGELISAHSGDSIEHSRLTSLVITQYTGLKDKNGKEIYDRDILLRDSGIYEVVQWRVCGWVTNSMALWELIDKYPIEVIGNIFENPELLQYKKES
jgi:hypothetical protein